MRYILCRTKLAGNVGQASGPMISVNTDHIFVGVRSLKIMTAF